jgi:hypothetical protein
MKVPDTLDNYSTSGPFCWRINQSCNPKTCGDVLFKKGAVPKGRYKGLTI